MKLAVVMITLNEADRIEPALASCRGVADEIVVVDGFSGDDTAALAARAGARVEQREFRDFADQKNYATSLARSEWVLNLDADERISPELRAVLLEWKERSDISADGFRIVRKTWYLGRWVLHSGWYPDRKLRLFRRERGRWHGRVHERLDLDGVVADLPGCIEHFTYRDIADHIRRINHYSSMQAADIAAGGKRALLARALLLPPVTFLRHYLWRAGFLDGLAGLVIALVNAFGTASKYLKALEIRRGR